MVRELSAIAPTIDTSRTPQPQTRACVYVRVCLCVCVHVYVCVCVCVCVCVYGSSSKTAPLPRWCRRPLALPLSCLRVAVGVAVDNTLANCRRARSPRRRCERPSWRHVKAQCRPPVLCPALSTTGLESAVKTPSTPAQGPVVVRVSRSMPCRRVLCRARF